MRDYSYCIRCDSEGPDGSSQCPSCGGRIVTTKRVRVLGWFLIVVGAFLALAMTALSIFIGSLVYQATTPGTGGRFTGTESQLAIIFGLFAVIFAVGLTSIFGGIWQVKYGKRNKKIQIITFGLVALIILAYWLVKIYLPHN